MAQSEKKTKQGLAGIPMPETKRALDATRSYLRESFGVRKAKTKSDPPISSRRGSKPTRRGMPNDKKKIVTKAGLAPPSNPPPLTKGEEEVGLSTSAKPTNPGFTPPPPLEEIQYELDGSTGDRKSRSFSDQERAQFREEMTPREGTDLRGRPSEGDDGDRSRFRTAPGGGRNRVSGGRAQAAAYVSPTTVAPGHGKDHITSAVKVDQIVANAVRAYETEPSLLRRRASSLPPRIPAEYERSSKLIWAAMAVGLILGGVVVWFAVAGVRAGLGEETRNESADRPKPADGKHEAPASGPAPGSSAPAPNSADPAPEQQGSPPASPKLADGPKNSASAPSAAPGVTSSPAAPVVQERGPQASGATPAPQATSTKPPAASKPAAASSPPAAPKPSPQKPPSDLWLE